ncbi:hypothetical protein HFN63_35435 [Rhizobium leguminosarum]|uniref:beta-ketoacyl synthase N-terminal-like domain-containing protein n=1 Tax=Rhizobium leguminosarum TaxID=384 RepID=UPI001C96E765|nr:beta-ketoacyl synthase N-terminal-like domain-containing protein [Rhizobium leguminosarum]MBY5775257.1 hypothetical protein [Rhizobium leguminosarum]
MNRKVVITAAHTLSRSDLEEHGIVADAPASPAISSIPDALVEISSPIGERLKRKIDGFCRKGLAVANRAIIDSRVLENEHDLARIGIYVGNCLGGWGYIEEEVRCLHHQGVSAMGPYVATAWFPAALQGQISLHYGFRGHSKTFSAFDVSGVQAFAYAAQAIALGLADAVICCASEDLSSPFVRRVLEETATRGWPASPAFGPRRALSGTEGAAAFVLEERQHALARGAPILCEIVGFCDRFVKSGNQIGQTLSSSVETLVHRELDPVLYVLDGRFSCERDETGRALSGRNIDAWLIDVSAFVGEQFSVGGLMEAAIVARALQDRRLSASTFGQPDDRPCSQAVIQRLSAAGNLAAIGFRGAGGRLNQHDHTLRGKIK